MHPALDHISMPSRARLDILSPEGEPVVALLTKHYDGFEDHTIFDACEGGESCDHGWPESYATGPAGSARFYPVGWLPEDYDEAVRMEDGGYDVQGDGMDTPYCECGWRTDAITFEKDATRVDVVYCENCRGYEVVRGEEEFLRWSSAIEAAGETAREARWEKWSRTPAQPLAKAHDQKDVS